MSMILISFQSIFISSPFTHKKKGGGEMSTIISKSRMLYSFILMDWYRKMDYSHEKRP